MKRLLHLWITRRGKTFLSSPCTDPSHLTTSMEAAPDLKKSVVSSMAGTLLRMPFQMFCSKKCFKWGDVFHLNHLQSIGRQQAKKNRITQGFTCPDLLCHCLLVIGQLHTGAFSGREIFGSRNHFPIFKLQVLH